MYKKRETVMQIDPQPIRIFGRNLVIKESIQKEVSARTPQKIIEALHTKSPSLRFFSNTPSIGVPANKEIATIENAMPMRTLQCSRISKWEIYFDLDSYPSSWGPELSCESNEGIRDTSVCFVFLAISFLKSRGLITREYLDVHDPDQNPYSIAKAVRPAKSLIPKIAKTSADEM